MMLAASLVVPSGAWTRLLHPEAQMVKLQGRGLVLRPLLDARPEDGPAPGLELGLMPVSECADRSDAADAAPMGLLRLNALAPGDLASSTGISAL